MDLALYIDADFAGHLSDYKSTTGVFLALVGQYSFYPLSGQSKKQTANTHSTPEAEILALDHGLRSVGLPAIDLRDVLLGKRVVLKLYEDSQPTQRIIATGKAPTLRHVSRVHSVSTAWLHERVQLSDDVELCDCSSAVMAADIFTKALVD